MALTRLAVALLACTLGIGGCAQSRYDQVKSSSRQTQSLLDDQLNRALAADVPSRQARIDQLTSIRYQLSAANVALGAVPYVLEQPAEQETAYSFLEEFYSTLAWNAKLPPDQPARALPANPLPGKLNLVPGR
ncbi:MAG: hypothetical protein QM783_08275 [Phycisphaerales bacterium]